MEPIRLIHVADIHLGFTGSTSLVFGAEEPSAGRYVREVDIERAVKWFTKRVIDEQPPVDIVVIAGDLFHRSVPLPRAIALAAQFVRRLVQNGIEVVIIDGNHEIASAIDTGSPTSFLAEFGAHVVNDRFYKVIRDDAWRRNTRLQGRLAVHALPYRAVLANDFAGVSPLAGCLNVLLTHGRLQGMDDLNSLHRASARIPTHMVRQGWDYIALGDWHTHRYQALADVPAYYAGSMEALNFGEASLHPPRRDDAYAIRGLLDVRLSPGKPADVYSLEYTERRPVLRLAPIDASDMAPEALMQCIRERLSDNLPPEALVTLEIKSCPASVKEQLDFVEIDCLRQRVRRCDIRWDTMRPAIGQSPDTPSEATLADQWREFLAQQIADEVERTWYLEKGTERIEAARKVLQSQQAHTGKE
jgi:DNA repair exonuclease SbcCD nuclease subunit